MNSESLHHDHSLCWNCEEIVHPQASQCPYCRAQMKHATKATHVVTAGDKITPLPTPQIAQETHASSSRSLDSKAASFGNTILSICLLFGGCNLLFLGILVGLFSRNGSFTLNWPEAHWPLYFGAGLSAIAFGLIALKSIDQKQE